jgi:hypothetical protein
LLVSIFDPGDVGTSETSGYLQTKLQDILFSAIGVRISTMSELQGKAVTGKAAEGSLRHSCVM